jgi:hypothetical protein
VVKEEEVVKVARVVLVEKVERSLFLKRVV